MEIELLPTPLDRSKEQTELETKIVTEILDFWRDYLPKNVLEHLEISVRAEQAERMDYQTRNFAKILSHRQKAPDHLKQMIDLVAKGQGDWETVLDVFLDIKDLSTIDLLSYTHRGHYEREDILTMNAFHVIEKMVMQINSRVFFFEEDIVKTKTGFPGLGGDIDPLESDGIRRVRPEKRFIRICESKSGIALLARCIDLALIFDSSNNKLIERLKLIGAFQYEYEGEEANYRDSTLHIRLGTSLFEANLKQEKNLRSYFVPPKVNSKIFYV